MYLIKSCGSCGKKLRFPIDKGRIRVRCTCGFNFMADPDDPGLFQDAEFDLNPQRGKKPPRTENFIPRSIKSFYNIKYKLQNFRLLPSGDQRRILLIVLGIILFIFTIIYLIFISLKPSSINA